MTTQAQMLIDAKRNFFVSLFILFPTPVPLPICPSKLSFFYAFPKNSLPEDERRRRWGYSHSPAFGQSDLNTVNDKLDCTLSIYQCCGSGPICFGSYLDMCFDVQQTNICYNISLQKVKINKYFDKTVFQTTNITRKLELQGPLCGKDPDPAFPGSGSG